MFRLVKVPPDTLIAIYRKKKSGEIDFFSAQHVTDGKKRVPVLWGYTYTLFSAAPTCLELDCEADCRGERAVMSLTASVAVTAWSAENAVKNLIGADYDSVIARAKEQIIASAADVVKDMTLAKARERKNTVEFAIARDGLIRLDALGLTLMSVNIRSIDKKS